MRCSSSEAVPDVAHKHHEAMEVVFALGTIPVQETYMAIGSIKVLTRSTEC